MSDRIAFTYWPGKVEDGRVVVRAVRHPIGQRVHSSWPSLLGRLSVSRVFENKNDAPGISIATFQGDYRKLENVERVFAVGIDIDHLDALPINMRREPNTVVPAMGWGDVIMMFDGYDSFVHTTWSSTDDAPRARAFIRLSRPVTADEYRRVYAAVAGVVESNGFLVDRQASDPSRFWFLPSIPPGGNYRYSVGRGKPVNVDGALAAVPYATRPAPPPRPAQSPTADMAKVIERAEKYLETCEPAIQGSKGSDVTFLTAMRIVRGFDLDEETALQAMTRWNERCSPPWKPNDLRRKIREAAAKGTMPFGELRDRDRRRSA